MKLAWLACVTVWGMSILDARVALAQNQPDFEAAKQHYFAAKEAARRIGDDRGVQRLSDWTTAVKEYQAAYDITKDPSLWKQIGAAGEAAGQYADAVTAYKRYLAESKDPPDADAIKLRIQTYNGEIPRYVGQNPPCNPGGFCPSNAALTPPSSTPAFLEEDGSWKRTAAWVSVGVAAVLVTTGSVFATSAMSREDDLNRLGDYRDPSTGLPKVYTGTVKTDYDSKVDDGNKLNTYATVAFIGAGAAAAAAVTFFLLDHAAARSEPAASIFVSPSGGGVTAAWEF